MFRLVNGGERLPQRATQFSAGFDVFANEDVEIMAGETVTVGLGIALDVNMQQLQGCVICGSNETYQDRIAGHYCDECGAQLDTEEYSEYFRGRYYLELHPRSSLRAKGIGGGVGIIDMDHPDEIKIVLTNPINSLIHHTGEDQRYSIKRGDKIGQLILKRHDGYLLPANYTVNAERTGGFGSTDA